MARAQRRSTGLMPMADTIAAIASARGTAGVGVIRVSGPDVPSIARTLLGRPPKVRHAHLATLRDGQGEALDSALLLYFEAPHSYTGEHVVELQGHGSPVVLAGLLRRVVELGARHARPGEFSERAFLNGKLDLAQAEAVADLIAAGSDAAARAAMRSLQGVFSERVHALVESLVRLRIHVEAAIDFPEEEIDFLADKVIAEHLDSLVDDLQQLLAECRRGVKLRDGQHAVILGPPNAGKSSLLNRLAGEERAIVTAQAGTTRDVLRETILLDGVELSLADTAGLHDDSSDPVEREGMRRALDERTRADLVLVVLSDGDHHAEARIRQQIPQDAAALWIHNKIDLSGGPPGPRRPGHFGICAHTGEGVDALRAALRTWASGASSESASFTARARHVDALERAAAHLALAETQLGDRQGELLAEELRCAQQVLGEITGTVDADALLGRIFSSFCIGK